MIEVLCITTRLSFGGVQTFFYNYAPLLLSKGVRLNFVVQTTDPQPYDKFMRILGARIFVVTPLTESKKLFMKDLFNVLKENPDISIVHAHQNFSNIFSLIVAERAGIKVRISHSHNNYATKSRLKNIARTISRILLPLYATDYWACSKDSASWLFGKFATDEKCVVIPNAIDVARFAFNKEVRRTIRKELGIDEKQVWIHSGSFGVAKNHAFLLELFNAYHSQNRNSVLVLCGDGELRSYIEHKIEEFHLERAVIILGLVRNVEDYLSAGDVLVFPSLFEGFPLSLIEAQSSGIACIVSATVPQDALYAPNTMRIDSFSKKVWIDAINTTLAIEYDRGKGKDCMNEAGFSIVKEATNLAEKYHRALERETT